MSHPSVPDDLPFSVINQSWNDEQRRIVWCLISKARRPLQVEIDPIIASAFIILQRYFRNTDESAYELFILMVAALFTACKAAGNFRPMKLVYGELTRICQCAPSIKIRSLLGDREVTQEYPVPDDAAIVQITRAEVDLLRSIDFNFDIDTPFVHFERWKQTLVAAIPDEALIRLCNSIIVDICLMICSAAYLDVPPEVAAAAATAHSADTAILPAETVAWMNTVRENYGTELFALAMESIRAEKVRTAPIRTPTEHEPR
jgi:hypothetical protein